MPIVASKPGTPQQIRGLVADLQVVAAHAQAAAFDLCLPYEGATATSRLAPVELDALKWSAYGLTNFEVGQKMGISATEALLRVRRAMAKLECASKYEAGLKAIRLGLISCD